MKWNEWMNEWWFNRCNQDGSEFSTIYLKNWLHVCGILAEQRFLIESPWNPCYPTENLYHHYRIPIIRLWAFLQKHKRHRHYLTDHNNQYKVHSAVLIMHCRHIADTSILLQQPSNPILCTNRFSLLLRLSFLIRSSATVPDASSFSSRAAYYNQNPRSISACWQCNPSIQRNSAYAGHNIYCINHFVQCNCFSNWTVHQSETILE